MRVFTVCSILFQSHSAHVWNVAMLLSFDAALSLEEVQWEVGCSWVLEQSYRSANDDVWSSHFVFYSLKTVVKHNVVQGSYIYSYNKMLWWQMCRHDVVSKDVSCLADALYFIALCFAVRRLILRSMVNRLIYTWSSERPGRHSLYGRLTVLLRQDSS